jgi:hypothetical protein
MGDVGGAWQGRSESVQGTAGWCERQEGLLGQWSPLVGLLIVSRQAAETGDRPVAGWLCAEQVAARSMASRRMAARSSPSPI